MQRSRREEAEDDTLICLKSERLRPVKEQGGQAAPAPRDSNAAQEDA